MSLTGEGVGLYVSEWTETNGSRVCFISFQNNFQPIANVANNRLLLLMFKIRGLQKSLNIWVEASRPTKRYD